MCVYIYIYRILARTGFWTPFCLQNCLNSLWNRLNKVLETFLRDLFWSILTFVGCTSMMRISRSTTSQMCSIGLRSGDCGGHLSKMNSLPPSVRTSRAPQVSALLECPKCPRFQSTPSVRASRVPPSTHFERAPTRASSSRVATRSHSFPFEHFGDSPDPLWPPSPRIRHGHPSSLFRHGSWNGHR